MIIHSLLKGDHPWIIFPEGQMIKDKKVIDPAGTFAVFNNGQRRPPHKGAAALALTTEFYRYKLRCMYDNPKQTGLAETCERFGVPIETIEKVLAKRTVVIPVNVTYFPIRARDNLMLRMAQRMAKDLSPRALEELSVEGTFLSSDTDIDITLGDPIDLESYLHQPEYAEIMACGDDLAKLEMDPRSLFHDAAHELMMRYMRDIYRHTRINYDHIFATIIRYQGAKTFTEREYRNRIYYVAHELRKQGKYDMHTLLERTYRHIIFEDPSPKFHDFMKLCINENVIEKKGGHYVRKADARQGASDFHSIRSTETSYVIANEVEPLSDFVEMVKDVANKPQDELNRRIRKIFFEEDFRIFEEDYKEFRSDESHHLDVGRPFLIAPDEPKAGVVLVHGYLAAPKEIRALANYLFDRGYAVYGVRLKGHGTSPEDLARTPWEEWYTSLNRGYVVIKTLTNKVILGGFSTGGCMALMGAGLKQEKVQAVFSINAPQKLRDYKARFASTVVSMNSFLKRIHRGREGWDFVLNDPENPHINYRRNPISGVVELGKAMDAVEQHLPNIVAPTLIIQASKDPVVHPSSGHDLFEAVGTPFKELDVLERDRHGIVNGPGAEDVFERVHQFLKWAEGKAPAISLPDGILFGEESRPALQPRPNAV